MDVESEIGRAIRFGDYQAVAAYARRGDDLTTPDMYGYTPLHHCAVSSISASAAAVITALGHGHQQLDLLTPFHKTPLLLAALHNNYRVFCMLLEYGADPNTRVMFEQTAIHWLVRQGKVRYIRKLIQHGADVNAMDAFSLTPLRIHLSATMDIRITRLLVKNGAVLNETRLDQRAILVMALYRWRTDHFINFPYLIAHGAEINAVNFIGDTALHFAARVGASEMASWLVLGSGAQMTARNKFGYTPYDLALQYGNQTTVETLRRLEEIDIERQMTLLGI